MSAAQDGTSGSEPNCLAHRHAAQKQSKSEVYLHNLKFPLLASRRCVDSPSTWAAPVERVTAPAQEMWSELDCKEEQACTLSSATCCSARSRTCCSVSLALCSSASCCCSARICCAADALSSACLCVACSIMATHSRSLHHALLSTLCSNAKDPCCHITHEHLVRAGSRSSSLQHRTPKSPQTVSDPFQMNFTRL